MNRDVEMAEELPCKVGDRVQLRALGDPKVPKYLDDAWAVVVRITKSNNIAVEPESDQSIRIVTSKHIKKIEHPEPEEEKLEQLPQRKVQNVDFNKLVTDRKTQTEELRDENTRTAKSLEPESSVDLFQYRGGDNQQPSELFGGFQNQNKPTLNLFMVSNALKQVECRIEDFANAVNKVFSACGYGYMAKSMVILEDYASEEIDYHIFVEAKGVHDICLKGIKRIDKGLLKIMSVWVAE